MGWGFLGNYGEKGGLKVKEVVIKKVGKQVRVTLYEDEMYEDDWLVDAICWVEEDK